MNFKDIKVLGRKEYVDYKKFYPYILLRDLNLIRQKCNSCNIFFWYYTISYFCGDRNCNKNIILKQHYFKETPISLSYKFKSFFRDNKFNHILSRKIIKPLGNIRFVNSGIGSFDKFLLDGEYTIPKTTELQFCIRFKDLEYVDKSDNHFSGFFMMGIHDFEGVNSTFNSDWKEKYLKLLISFLNFCGLDFNNFYLHEDLWSNGVSIGPSIELFYNGVQIFNQVYIINNYDQKMNNLNLRLKILDTGGGFQRLYKILTSKDYIDSLTDDLMIQTLKLQKLSSHKRMIINLFQSILFIINSNIYPSKKLVGYNLRTLFNTLKILIPEFNTAKSLFKLFFKYNLEKYNALLEKPLESLDEIKVIKSMEYEYNKKL